MEDIKFFNNITKKYTHWLWQGCIGTQDYGVISRNVGGKWTRTLAHRYSWTLHKGDIPAGYQVQHACGIRNCVNPEHLYLGTDKDKLYNTWDAVINANTRFWCKVEIKGNNSCWNWQGHKRSGYGRFSFKRDPISKQVTVDTHVFSYKMFYGSFTQGLHVCHYCDNPSCVNPSHLFLGTHRDNMKDAATKGRTYKPPKKLTKKQRQLVADSYNNSRVTEAELANRFGVSAATISRYIKECSSGLIGHRDVLAIEI